MANLAIRILVGKHEANEMGREYKFSVGNPKSKISNTQILDIIEKALEKELTSIYGFYTDPR